MAISKPHSQASVVVPTTGSGSDLGAVGNPTAAPALTPAFPCTVDLNSDGSADVMFHVEPEVMRRIKLRAQTQDLASYLWLNILRRSIEGHVY